MFAVLQGDGERTAGDEVGATAQNNRTGTAIRREYPALTGLRAVAALWVVLYHAANALSGAYEQHLPWLWPILHAGWLGVDLFFVLSGFVIANAYLPALGRTVAPRKVVRFLWARLARVWPVWVLVSAVFGTFLVLVGAADGKDSSSAPVTVVNTLKQLLMVQLWTSPHIDRTSYVVPGWSLSAEWLAYVCFPLVALVLYRFRRLPVVVLATASIAALLPWAYLIWVHGDHPDFWQYRIAGCFLAGALMNMTVTRLTVTPRLERLAGLVAVLAVGELVIVCWWSLAQEPFRSTPVSKAGLAVLVFPVLVGALAVTRTGLARALRSPLMQVGGKASYSLYLLHSCTLIGFEYVAHANPHLTPGGPAYMLLLPQVILGSLLISYALWRWVEEPSRRWLMARAPFAEAPQRPAPTLLPLPNRRPVAEVVPQPARGEDAGDLPVPATAAP